MTTKMTNKKALEFVLSNCTLPTDVSDKLSAMVAAIERKNGAERKPTAKQNENAVLRAALVEFVNENAEDNGFTVTDLIKSCPAVEGMSQQKVSAILRQAVLGGELSKVSIKRRTHFVPFDPTLTAEVEGE